MSITGRKATFLVGALIVSVCLNVFAAAGWAIQAFGDRSHGRGGGFGIGRLVRTAPEEVQDIVRAQFAAARPEIRARFAALHEAREGVARAIHDPDATPAALQEAFAEMRRRSDEVEILVHGTLIEALDAMPEEVRVRWASEWRERR